MKNIGRRKFVALVAAIVAVLAGAAMTRDYLTGSPAPETTRSTGENKAAPVAPAGRSGEPNLIICPVDQCPADVFAAPPAQGEAPKQEQANRCPPSGECSPQQPGDETVHCLAIGCPTGDGNERPVSDDEKPPERPAGRMPADPRARSISSFEECVSAGYPVAESYPQQCVTPYGTFTQSAG